MLLFNLYHTIVYRYPVFNFLCLAKFRKNILIIRRFTKFMFINGIVNIINVRNYSHSLSLSRHEVRTKLLLSLKTFFAQMY